jgi:hypothetical protein
MWPKYGTEFFPQCAEADLSSDAVRTHAEGIAYLYQVESRSLEIRRHRLRAVVFCADWEAAVAELVAKKFWKESPAGYRVVHHADVIRQSMAAQWNKRERDKKAQREKRARDKKAGVHVSADISAYVIPDTDRQTDRQIRALTRALVMRKSIG